MTWDLGKAMRKKEEFESARLLDFEFRLRARTVKLLARELGLDAAALVAGTVMQDHAALIATLATEAGRAAADVERLWSHKQAEVRQALIAERGDPTPYRLG